VTLSIISGIRKALGDNAKIGYLRPVTILQEQEDHHQQLKQQHEGPKTHLEQEEGNEDDSPLVCKYLYSLNENQSSPSSSVVQILDDGTVHTPSHSTPTSSELQSNRLRHLENIRTSYENLADDVDILVIQGAGHHAAVGTFAGMGNARMARNLGGSVVLVGGGGIGATFDELEVNRVLCQVSQERFLLCHRVFAPMHLTFSPSTSILIHTNISGLQRTYIWSGVKQGSGR